MMLLILQGLQLVVAHIREVVGVDGASGEPDDHRARSGIGHLPAHKLQRIFPPCPPKPRLNDRSVPTHPILASPVSALSQSSSMCATTIGLARLLLKSVTRLASASRESRGRIFALEFGFEGAFSKVEGDTYS
jgi:hypothetical protein